MYIPFDYREHEVHHKIGRWFLFQFSNNDLLPDSQPSILWPMHVIQRGIELKQPWRGLHKTFSNLIICKDRNNIWNRWLVSSINTNLALWTTTFFVSHVKWFHFIITGILLWIKYYKKPKKYISYAVWLWYTIRQMDLFLCK